MQSLIKSRHDKAALAAKSVLEVAAKAAKAPRVKKPAKIAAGNGLFAPMEFLAKPGPGRTIAEIKKGEEIFAQGDEATAVFYIQKGRIRISVVSKAGKEATVALLGAGNFLGEECIAAPKVHHVASATALRFHHTQD